MFNKLETPMDNNINVENGHLSAFCAILLGITTWLTPQNVEYGLKILVAVGSIVTAVMAVRYYYFATLEKKKNLNDKGSSKKLLE